MRIADKYRSGLMSPGKQEIGGDKTFANSVVVLQDFSLQGDLGLDSGTLVTSSSVASVFNDAASLTIGTNAASTLYNIAIGTTASGATKVVNIGTNGSSGSTTTINIGSLFGGTTTLQNYTLIDDSLKINTDLTVGSSNRLTVQGSTGNTTTAGTLAVNSGTITTTAASCSLFASASSLVVGGSATSSLSYSIASGATASGFTKTINIGTNGSIGSTTNINIGSSNTTSGTTTVNNSLLVRGDFTVQGTTATVNTTNLEVKDTNITVNKDGTNTTAEGAGLTVEGNASTALARILYDSTLASKFKLGSFNAESEVITSSGNQNITSSKNFTAPQTMLINSTSPALSITQVGSGHALLVEDTTPDSSPFVVDASGKVGVGTLNLTADFNVSGRALIGNQVSSTGFSNAISTSVSDGVNAYRSVNVVDSSGVLKIATSASTDAGIEIQTWNSNFTANSSYWDMYCRLGHFGIRDKKNYNRIFAHANGTVLIGGTTADAESASDYILNFFGNGYSLVNDGDMYVTGNLNVSSVSNANLENCVLNNIQKTNFGTEAAVIDSTSQTINLVQGLPIQRIQSGTTLGGMNLGSDGRLFILTNETSNDITILHESSVAAAPYRFNTPDGLRFLMKPRASVLAYYNGSLGRWVVMGDNPPPTAIPYKSVSANYTITTSDYFITATGATALTLTLPTAIGVSGTIYYVKNRLNAGLLLRINTTASQRIDDATFWSLARNETLSIISNGANWEVF